MMSSDRIPPKGILCTWGHSASTPRGKGKGVDENATRKSYIERRVFHEVLSMWVVCTYMCVSKNSSVSKDVIFYIL